MQCSQTFSVIISTDWEKNHRSNETSPAFWVLARFAGSILILPNTARSWYSAELNISLIRKSSLLLSAARLAENELVSGDDRPLPVRLSLPSIYVTQPTSQPGTGPFVYKKWKIYWSKKGVVSWSEEHFYYGVEKENIFSIFQISSSIADVPVFKFSLHLCPVLQVPFAKVTIFLF